MKTKGGARKKSHYTRLVTKKEAIQTTREGKEAYRPGTKERKSVCPKNKAVNARLLPSSKQHRWQGRDGERRIGHYRPMTGELK